MENFDDELVGGYSINYELLLKNGDILAVTKLLAQKLMTDGYHNVGDFLKSLSDDDLQLLCEQTEPGQEGSDLILIAEMLATGEGLDCSPTVDDFIDRVGILSGFVNIESLKRKGLVKVHYEYLSFGDDMADKVIVEKI